MLASKESSGEAVELDFWLSAKQAFAVVAVPVQNRDQ